MSHLKHIALLGIVVALAACDDATAPLFTDPNPLLGEDLLVVYPTNASLQADEWRDTRPADAAAMDRIAAQPRAIWLADGDPVPELAAALDLAEAADALPVFVLYFIPGRDCTGAGAADAATYRAWVDAVAGAIGGREAVVIVEPDALAMAGCAAAPLDGRLALLAYATRSMAAAGAVVYLDAGHPRWLTVEMASDRLARAGIQHADGFALNVANFVGTAENVEYGRAIARELGGTRFVVDTSRNGAGPAPDGEWCNPPGRKLGPDPTTSPPYAGVDALLWIKRPGESDGTCNGGPPAGEWWPEQALELAS